MAKAIANCTCRHCGRGFEREVFGGNRRDADSKAEWTSINIDLCPDCYREYRRKEDAKTDAANAARYNLPAIKAVSDKQRAYAESLRAQYIRHNSAFVESTYELLNNIDEEYVANMVKETGKSREVLIREAMDYRARTCEYIVLTSSDAREIIDTLKRWPK